MGPGPLPLSPQTTPPTNSVPRVKHLVAGRGLIPSGQTGQLQGKLGVECTVRWSQGRQRSAWEIQVLACPLWWGALFPSLENKGHGRGQLAPPGSSQASLSVDFQAAPPALNSRGLLQTLCASLCSLPPAPSRLVRADKKPTTRLEERRNKRKG